MRHNLLETSTNEVFGNQYSPADEQMFGQTDSGQIGNQWLLSCWWQVHFFLRPPIAAPPHNTASKSINLLSYLPKPSKETFCFLPLSPQFSTYVLAPGAS